MNVAFSRSLAKTRFQHRVTDLPDGTLAYRLADGSGFVRVTRDEWEDTGNFFNESTRGSLRDARIFMFLAIPMYVVYIAICGAIVPRDVARALPEWLYLLIFIGPLPGIPIAIYLKHSYDVKRVCSAIDETLAQRARIAAPPANAWRPPFWIDLLCLLFVGPQLIIAVIGEMNPELFRDTPLTGRHIDSWALFGFALVAARLLWGELARRRAQAPQASR